MLDESEAKRDIQEVRNIVSPVYGYARVSTTDQNLDAQVEKLQAAGAEVIRSEKMSGTNRDGRDELATMMEFMREGDTLLVTRIDRLARSVRDLMNIVHELGERGVRVKATEQSFDTGDIYGEMTMNLLAVFADFETKLRKERQMEGIERAKKRGVYQGRKPTIDADQVKTLKEQGMGATAIAKELGIGRASVYRVLGGAA